jgi:signal transduction histidine kinase
MDPKEPAAMSLMGILPWVADYLVDAPDLRQVRLLPLSCGWGTAAVVLHDRPALPPWQQLSALAATWGAAIAAASQHDGARRLGEELAEANRALAHAQDRLLQSESMARLGEMAAGAAHEMNNPLAVISGRSQLLTLALDPNGKEHKAAQTIFEQAHRLSDLITSLRLFADPPRAKRSPTDVPRLLQDVIKRVKSQTPGLDRRNVFLEIKGSLPQAFIDAEQIGNALAELVANAFQAGPKTSVTVTAQADAIDQTLVLQVIDDGPGMDEHTLAHALDPFFSAKPAGRRVGMGLPRAQQWAAAHNGTLELRSAPGEGTVATLSIPLDSGPANADA